MKYKLEYWPYGEFDTAEAAEHLNRRAAEGWELVNIAAQLIGGALGLALYCRNPRAKGYRYTADIVAFGDNEEYLGFCRDAGWEPLIKMDNGVQIFVSRDGSRRPLYTSPETEYDHQLQVFRYNHGDSASPVPYFVGIAVWLALLVWIVFHFDASVRSGLTRFAFCWTGIVVVGIIHCVNLVFIRLALRRAEQGKAVKRPGWMAKGFKLISIGVSLLFLLLIAGLCYFSVACGIPPALVIVLTAVFLTLFALGIWMQLFKRKEAAGKRMTIGSLLIYVGVLFLMVQFS